MVRNVGTSRFLISLLCHMLTCFLKHKEQVCLLCNFIPGKICPAKLSLELMLVETCCFPPWLAISPIPLHLHACWNFCVMISSKSCTRTVLSSNVLLSFGASFVDLLLLAFIKFLVSSGFCASISLIDNERSNAFMSSCKAIA